MFFCNQATFYKSEIEKILKVSRFSSQTAVSDYELANSHEACIQRVPHSSCNKMYFFIVLPMTHLQKKLCKHVSLFQTAAPNTLNYYNTWKVWCLNQLGMLFQFGTARLRISPLEWLWFRCRTFHVPNLMHRLL